jgi:hypothetical protein
MDAKSRSFRSLKLMVVIGITAIALLMTLVVVNAAFYSINTDDTKITDWASVTPFATDPAGDFITPTAATGSNREDLVNSWVVEGTSPAFTSPAVSPQPALFFRAQMAAGPALREGTNSRKQVSVYLDCNNDGQENQFYDRIITYRPTWVPAEGAQPDTVIISSGDRGMSQLASGINGKSPWGEIPTPNTDLEWGAPLSQILTPAPTGNPAPGTPTPTALPTPWGCNGQIGIKFSVSDYTLASINATPYVQDSTGFRSFNVPTNLDMQDFRPEKQGYPFSTAAIVLGVLLLAGGIAITIFQKLK